MAQPPNDPQNARRCPLVKRSGSATRVSVSLPLIRGGCRLIVMVNLDSGCPSVMTLPR